MIRTSGAKTIRGTAGDGLEDVREDIAGRVDIVQVDEWYKDDYRQRCIGVEMARKYLRDPSLYAPIGIG